MWKVRTVPDGEHQQSRSTAYHCLTSFAVVPMTLGLLYFGYRLLNIVLYAMESTTNEVLISVGYLAVEMAFAGTSHCLSCSDGA